MSTQDTVRRLTLLLEHNQMFADDLAFIFADGTVGDVAYENQEVLLVSDVAWALAGGEPDDREAELAETD